MDELFAKNKRKRTQGYTRTPTKSQRQARLKKIIKELRSWGFSVSEAAKEAKMIEQEMYNKRIK